MISSHFFNEGKHQFGFVLLKVSHLIGLQTVAEMTVWRKNIVDSLLNVLVPVIITTGIREEDLRTILMQYSVLKNTILSMVENLDVVEQYIMRRDDDEDEAVED